MKSVLVQINRDAGQEARLEAALDVVRAFNGHLTCLQVSPFETYVPADPYGVSHLLKQTYDQIREEEEAERREIEDDLRNEGVNWDWVCHAGSPARLLAEHSWLTELIVVSAPEQSWPVRLEAPPVAADLVMRSRAPVLVMPDTVKGLDCGGIALVAWNGSPEACQAIRDTLPLLKQAREVVLATVEGEDGPDLPPIEASTFLARHGVASEIVELPTDGKSVCDVLRSAAAAREAAYIVMGAYGHSRLRERFLGGVTREMLADATFPLVLSH